MAASSASFLKSPAQPAAPHAHLDQGVCPLCEQPIPHDRFEEIKDRIEARERQRGVEITSQLQEQFSREKAHALELAQQEATRVLDLERDAAKKGADELRRLLNAQLTQARKEAQAAVELVRQEAAAKETAIRAEAVRDAQAAMQTKLAEAERARKASDAALQARIEHAESAKAISEKSRAELVSQLQQVRQANDANVEKLKQDAALRESLIREEASAAAQAAANEKIAELDRARSEAEVKTIVAEQHARNLQENQEAQITLRLGEQRAILEQAQVDAVNAEKAAAFQATLKLSAKVDELQRAIDKKSAEELGEGAEIDLFEALKAEFDGDRIERVSKGLPGADILHTVIHNGKECGKIIYDSKNHAAWRNDFVTKLATDQMAAKAEHAILSASKFPAGARQLLVQDGVIVASPSRVVTIVQIIRQHLVQSHALRVSSEERKQKTAALYDFITSERCTDLLARFDTHAEDLLDVQLKEKKAHDATWKRQGELIRSVQKVRAELCNEIDVILGTSETMERAS